MAPNKLLAKLASELDKPNGITIIHSGDLQARIWPLPCRKINGVGPKGAARLEQLGVRTIGELGAVRARLADGAVWPSLRRVAARGRWGRDEREVVTESEPVRMSRETTFERDLHAVRDRRNWARYSPAVRTAGGRPGAQGLRRRTIGVKLRYDNFRSVTRAHTLDFHTADAAVIRRTAGQCLKRAPLDRRLRLLGVRIGGLVPAAAARAPEVERSLELF